MDPVTRRTTVAALLFLLMVQALAGCAAGDTAGAPGGAGATPPAAAVGGELLVLGAASLSDVLGELAAAYEDVNPVLRVVIATDGSDALRARVEEGVAADVFVSADTANPERLARAGLTLGDPTIVAANGLVIAVAPQRRDEIRSPLDLAGENVRIIAAGRGVPISTYAQQAIEQLAGLDGYPADYAARLEANTVSREDNVRAALAKVALGEGDAAFVYATDVLGQPELGVVELPSPAAIEAEYAAVALSAAPAPGTARDFVAWLGTAPARAIFAAAGFRTADP